MTVNKIRSSGIVISDGLFFFLCVPLFFLGAFSGGLLPTYAVSIGFLLVGVVYFYRRRHVSLPLLTLLVLGMRAEVIVLFALVMMLGYFCACLFRGRVKLEVLIFFSAFLLLLLQAAFLGGYVHYSFIRIVTVFFIPFLIIFFSNKYSWDDKGWFPVYFFIYFVNMAYVILGFEQRGSIFNGSENMALLIVYALAVLAISSAERIWMYAVVLASYIGYALMFTQSRSAIVLAIGLFLYVIYRFMKQDRLGFSLSFRALLVMILVFCAAIFFVSFINSEIFFSLRLDRVFSIAASGSFESDARGLLTIEGYQLFMQRPWFGLGAIKPEFFDFIVDQKVVSFHNSYIDMMVQFGVVGLLVVATAYYSAFRFLEVNWKEAGLFFFPVVFLAFVQPYFFSLQVVWMIGMFLLARRLPQRASRNQASCRPSAVIQ